MHAHLVHDEAFLRMKITELFGTGKPVISFEFFPPKDEKATALLGKALERLRELDSHTSYLNPAWYGMSFALGALAGAISDKVSLGFVAATEERVCGHLRDHLKQLPQEDRKSQLILQQMLEDEQRHGEKALEAGGIDFPKPVKDAMSAVSKLMTRTSYRF